MIDSLPPAQFDALNKLGKLLAVTYHTHEATPDVVFVTAWDERSQNMVCWSIIESLPWVSVDAKIRRARREITWALNQQNSEANSDSIPEWTYGIAYVKVGAGYTNASYEFAPVRLTPADYASIVAAVRGES